MVSLAALASIPILSSFPTGFGFGAGYGAGVRTGYDIVYPWITQTFSREILNILGSAPDEDHPIPPSHLPTADIAPPDSHQPKHVPINELAPPVEPESPGRGRSVQTEEDKIMSVFHQLWKTITELNASRVQLNNKIRNIRANARPPKSGQRSPVPNQLFQLQKELEKLDAQVDRYWSDYQELSHVHPQLFKRFQAEIGA